MSGFLYLRIYQVCWDLPSQIFLPFYKATQYICRLSIYPYKLCIFMIFYKITVIYWLIIVKYDICISIISAPVKGQ